LVPISHSLGKKFGADSISLDLNLYGSIMIPFCFYGNSKLLSFFLFSFLFYLNDIQTNYAFINYFSFSQLRTYKGHVNEKNFVGLSVNSEYIACGSETNEAFVYHKVKKYLNE
jgi:hypothetical protein